MTTPNPGPEPTVRTRTHVVIVIDRSGSMGSLRGFVVEEANRFLELVKPSTVVTVAQFDGQDPFALVVDGLPAAEVTPITYDQFEPRGSTPLYDAVGTAITRTAGVVARDAALGIRTAVVMGIITDGCENASVEYTERQVSDLIEHFQDTGWQVSYIGLGLGEEAHQAAQALKVRPDKSRSYGRSPEGVRASFSVLLDDVDDLDGRGEPGSATGAA